MGNPFSSDKSKNEKTNNAKRNEDIYNSYYTYDNDYNRNYSYSYTTPNSISNSSYNYSTYNTYKPDNISYNTSNPD